MIRLRLVPNGMARLPSETREDPPVIAALKDNAGDVPTGATSPLAGWEEVRRVRVGDEELRLELPGTLDEYLDAELEGFASTMVESLDGVKVHSEGWTEVETADETDDVTL
jgi:hypothetical protein